MLKVPAIHLIRAAAQWAKANGVPFRGWKEQKPAIEKYIKVAIILN